MGKRIALIQGHPDPAGGHFGHALAGAYERAATEAAPFLAFRGLVMANPVWYPTLDDRVRRKLLNFIINVLGEATFDPARANEYCE